ncbi:hypothetical protein KAU45_03090 [bacterium]|nr:hypothetical protein [bacterium]
MSRFAKSFLLVFLAPIPLILYALLPEMTGWNPEVHLGEFWNTVIWILLIGFVLVMSLLPFKKAFGAFFGTKESKRIARFGRPAEAVVLAIGENSEGGVVTINDQPLLNLQLEVHDGATPPYVVSFDTIIPRAAVPRFQPGAVIPIKIDPENPQKVIVDWQRGASDAPAEKPAVGARWSEMDKQLLEREGIDGTAKYLSLEDTGRSKDFNPIVRVTLEVEAPDIEPYTFTKDVPLPTYAIQLIRGKLGQSFPARIHPQDGTKVSINITP